MMTKGELWPKPKLQVKKNAFLMSQLPNLKYKVEIHTFFPYELNYLESTSLAVIYA